MLCCVTQDSPLISKMAPLFVSSLVALLLVTLNSALSAKIAGFSGTTSGSHYFVIKKAMEELSSRGHEVVLVKPSNQKESRSGDKIPHKIYQVPFDAGSLEEFVVKAAIKEGSLRALINMNELQKVACECLLNNTELLQDLRNFDLIVYEGGATCAVLVADLLGIPRVVIIPVSPNFVFASYFNIPVPVSYVPSRFSRFASKMSFTQRFANLGLYIFSRLVLHVLFAEYMSPLKDKYNITPGISFHEALGKVELVIIQADFALEYPQPLLPGNIMVGPITVQAEPSPLPPDLVDFINSAGGNGFVIASFGSYAQTVIPKEKIDVLATAFGKLKQKVIWKLKGYIPSFLSPNIKEVDWLPQNDLLAHKDIKAFVSHVGHNSLYESAYHGVPVVAVPLFADQFSNAKKAEHFGLGIVVDHQSMNAQQLFDVIEHVINEPRFKTEAMRISRLMKDSPRTPVEKTGDWIEYVLRHGGAQHLRAQVFNIPWYQYYLLDVLAFLVAIVTLVVMVIRLTCRCLCRVCCRPSSNKTKKE
ncbi:UDP-glucuronosyltransferase 2C1-like isoform X2 [Oculina patagonica]